MPYMRGRLLPCLTPNKRGGISFVLMRGRDVIGVAAQYELIEYLKMPGMPSDLELFTKLEEAGRRLEKSINLEEIKRGDAIYGLYGVIDPNYAKHGFSLDFWWHGFATAGEHSFKDYYSRVSSPVSLKMIMKLGAEILAETDVILNNGTSEKLWMIKLPFKNVPSLRLLRSLSKKKSRQELPESARL